jgi:superoxide oxidase
MATDPAQSPDSPPPVNRYRSGAIAFHWVTFLLVVIVGVLGLLHDSWPRETQAFWINMHALLGILLWLALVARFRYRNRYSPPKLPANIGAFSRKVSRPVHLALYALMFITPIFGVVTFLYHGRVFDFGFFSLNFGISKNPAIFHPTEDIHGYLAYALFTLAGLHALAALWHQFILHDGVLSRMWPPRDLS